MLLNYSIYSTVRASKNKNGQARSNTKKPFEVGI